MSDDAQIVKITLVQDENFWYINIDGKRSNRVKEKTEELCFKMAMYIALQHNTMNMHDNIHVYWDVVVLGSDGVEVAIFNCPTPRSP